MLQAPGATVADGRFLREVPDPALEAELPLGQRPHRADVDDVARVVVVQLPARKQVDDRPVASIQHAQLMALRDLLAETDAAGAEDAPLLVQHDVGSDGKRLLPLDLVLEDPALVQAMLHVEVLEVALPRLVADGTVERMVDQQELQHGLAHAEDLRRIGGDLHAVPDLGVAGDLELGHAFDLDGAHAATAGDAESRVVAVAGDHHAQPLRGFQDVGARFHLDVLPVDIERYHGVHRVGSEVSWDFGAGVGGDGGVARLGSRRSWSAARSRRSSRPSSRRPWPARETRAPGVGRIRF